MIKLDFLCHKQDALTQLLLHTWRNLGLWVIAGLVLALSPILTAEPLFRGSPSPPPPAPAQQVARLLELTNRQRLANAVPPVRLSDILNRAAENHAQDLADHNFVSHTGSDGSSIGSRADRVNYRWRTLGENIYRGVGSSPERAIAGWMRSPGHRRNLLDPRFGEVGFGIAQRGIYTFYVQVLARPL